ncbi:MAG TPA: hypothetical protein VE198_13745, partial [Actinoallomurus sp.]|nr:hypothetical protein [Actinoallomurus sp.]
GRLLDGSPHPSKSIDLVMPAMLGGRERTAAEWRDLLDGRAAFPGSRRRESLALLGIEATLRWTRPDVV